MKIYKETITIEGGWNRIINFIKWFSSPNIAGYRFYVTQKTNLTNKELLELRKIPLFLPDSIATIVGKWLIGRPVRMCRMHNLVPTVSRTAIAAALAGQCSSLAEIEINYQELGTGTTAPANGDTGLQTPSAGTRKVLSSISQSLNVISITSFWAATEATGTWKEFCLFINGTATSNSGTAFNRIAIDVTVASTEAMTLDGEIVIN